MRSTGTSSSQEKEEPRPITPGEVAGFLRRVSRAFERFDTSVVRKCRGRQSAGNTTVGEGYADGCRRPRNFKNSRPSARRRLQTSKSRAISLRKPKSLHGRK